ncbi:C39 family peptidase [Streptosporangium sp. NBC_01755]|uniref:C39 family peptidase n=1 Tax=unclassified Streptosporangium TaxID=2632669 RepID=UPI002DDAD019|nr:MULTISPECIES: C39 family peptidase [unclassified Streptosporangium]WSA28814.1 C39 family peptidase [Streptosporangium sp. NBC_01810]WSC99738.1 C39 family peptidase [Streptosporangium sp. NBC_01755]
MGCLACEQTTTGGREQTLHDGVAVYTQYMTPDLIEAIAYQGADPADDLRWAESGASTRTEYGTWARHCCGMAGLQMVLDHRDGHAPPMLELLRGCVPYGGYVEDGQGAIKGLYYQPFADYARAEHGLDATVHPHLTMQEVPDLLVAGNLVMVSVHKEIRRPDRPAPGQGGHLVLVTGYDHGTVHFLNPSGHTPNARRATLPAEVFGSFFGGRGITLVLG